MTNLNPFRRSAVRRLSGPARRKSRGQSLVEFALVVPLMALFFVAVADFARLYMTMMTIESAAREAADYGSFSSAYWTDQPGTEADMTHRACLASSNLPDYVGTRDDAAATCTNPEIIDIELIPQPGSGPCIDPQNPRPCWVRVTLEYDFRLLSPFSLQFYDVTLGIPEQLTFRRTSTFAMTDLALETPPPPTPIPTPYPEPTQEPTPTPEITPEPTPDPGPTPTPDPGPTPTPDPEPTPGPTPPPNPTPTPEPDPTATPTPDPPDPTPTPTPTPPDDPTPEPTP